MPRKRNYKHKKKTTWVKKFFILCFIVFIIAGTFSSVVLFFITQNLPDPFTISTREIPESTKIYDRTKKILLYEIHGEEKRTIIPFYQINRYIKDATIVAEDFDFYIHKGIDIKSIARAFIVDVLQGKISQGGSTITQQLVKNAFLTPEKTIIRKIKEIILSIKIERNYTKEEIFGFYLNQIPYGSNAYGIESAALTFFSKNASKLTLNESVLLATLPKAPSYYSPYGKHKDNLIYRKNNILKKMHSVGFITKKELEEASNEKLIFTKQKIKINAPHFTLYVRDYLEKKYGKKTIENSGFIIQTTLDNTIQKIAENAIEKFAKENEEKYNATNAALVAVDSKTGQLLAMVGSRDYFDIENEGNYNVTTSKHRQPGSSFKPFAYAEFFKKGFPPETILFDVKTEFSTDTDPEKSYSPQNYNETFQGPVSVKNALAQSLNVPAVKVLYLAGISNTVNLAHDFGITSLNNPEEIGLSLVLGGGEVSPIDMAYAYSVFANEGIRNTRSFILNIQDTNGNTLEQWKNNKKQVLDKNIARTITNILADNTLRTPVFGANSPLYFEQYDVAAKTGTTQKYKDAWVVGYTPSITVVVWVGNNNGDSMKDKSAGSVVAGPIFHEFMKNVLQTKRKEYFTKPNPITNNKQILNGEYIHTKTIDIDIDSKKLATQYTPPHKIQKDIFGEIHTILHYVNKKNIQEDISQNTIKDIQYENWENGLAEWLEENPNITAPIKIPPVLSDDIHTIENKPNIIMSSPKFRSIFSDSLPINIQVNSHFTLKEVDFFIDDVLVSSVFSPPFTPIINTKHILKGLHTLDIKAYDIYDNVGIYTIDIIK